MAPITRFVLSLSVLLVSSLSIAGPSIIPKPPALAASSYILLDANSGEVLVEKNADEVLPPASLTKMMTSYIISEELSYGNIREDETTRVSSRAWAQKHIGSSLMWLKEGEQVSMIDLLRGIIISSGKDATIAAAEHISGSEEAFVDVMNQYAVAMGLDSTKFKNVHGLDEKGHQSTARDMAHLAKRIVFDHPTYYSLYKEKKFKYNGISTDNRNLLLFWDPKVDGLKTGHTNKAGYCLVTSAEDNGMRLISVVMGAKSERGRARESQKLLTYGFRYFESHKLYDDQENLHAARVWLGETDELALGVKDGVYITIPRGQKGNLDVKYSVDEVIKAPIIKGMEYGRMTVSLEDKVLMDKPLIALSEIKEAGFISRIWDYIKLFFFSLFT